MANAATVQEIYAAFGRGDVPAILERLTEDVAWEYGISSTPIPWLQPRRGRAAVGEFFASLGALEFHRFEPKRLLEDGPVVVAIVDLEATVRATGRRIVEEDEVHLWHFDTQGRVTRFRHRVDTYQHRVAWRGGTET